MLWRGDDWSHINPSGEALVESFQLVCAWFSVPPAPSETLGGPVLHSSVTHEVVAITMQLRGLSLWSFRPFIMQGVGTVLFPCHDYFHIIRVATLIILGIRTICCDVVSTVSRLDTIQFVKESMQYNQVLLQSTLNIQGCHLKVGNVTFNCTIQD